MSRILIADIPDGAARLGGLLGQKHQLVYANTVKEATSMAYDDGFDLIIVGILFDESRMYDLIGQLKRNPSLKGIPVMGFSSEASWRSRATRDQAEMTTHLMGVCDYVCTMTLDDKDIVDRIEHCLNGGRRGIGKHREQGEETPGQKRRKQEDRHVE